MSYKTILLHLDALPECRHRVEAGLDLATRFGARVRGLATTGSMVRAAGFGMAPSGVLLAEYQDYLEKQARAAVAGFEEAARGKAYARIETRITEENDVLAIARDARFADLVVIGQEAPGERRADGSHLRPGDVVLACPRPVLVVPYIGAPTGFGKHILLAWNGSRESCRAASDAMPLLKKAERVTVMVVNSADDGDNRAAVPGADLAAFLADHDVAVTVQDDKSPVREIGEELLSRIADLGADLLVMGAYGHSRAHEWVFGGTTRTILASMTVPVLMSH